MNDKPRPGADDADEADDAYVIEDTGATIEDLEREMEEAAAEAVSGSEGSEPALEGELPGDGTPEEILQAENRQLKDRVLRTLADFENYRKRADREKTDFFKYAVGGVLKDILPVLDNFDRALEHAEEGDDFHRGVLMIYKQLFDVLQKHGLTPIEEEGVAFDPNIHEAVVREEDDSVPSHTVIAILQKGYFVHDRLLRPALVRVAVGGRERSV
jgi:molecular chaperone GrpE